MAPDTSETAASPSGRAREIHENPLPEAAELPGTAATFLLLTAITLLTGVFSGHRQVGPVVRPLYFAVLFSFFYAIGRRQPELRALPFRLIEGGFLVLTLGFTAAATIRGLIGSAEHFWMIGVLERGGVFLIGLSLISYGIILWIPQLLRSQRILHERYRHTRGELKLSEKARSRMEQRFVEADRLHALGELAAGVAHDLRNPLAIIKAAADSMTRAQRDPEDLAQHTQVIRRNVDRAERTISGLLDLGRPRDFSPRPVDLLSTAREVVRLVEVESRRRGVRIEVAPDGARAGVTALADPRLLSQALLNLVLNALQASPADTTVRIRARAFRIADGTDLAALAVEDEGVGLAPEARGKLFTPFYTTKSGGTGLGLLSSRRILDEMSGSIALFPRSAGGTRALLLLPVPAAELVEAR